MDSNIILGAIIIFFILYLLKEKKETFEYCTDCNHKSYNKCINCTNCGVCIKDDKMYCEPGDANGPYKRIDCNKWLHGWRNLPNNQQIFYWH